MSQAELRRAVADQGAISTIRLISGVEDFTGGRVVDIRAFDVDAVVIYRIVVRHGDGKVSALMVDGFTGRAIDAQSAAGKQVGAISAASSGMAQLPGTANSNARNNANANAGNRGNAGNRNNSGGGRGNSNSGGKK